MNHDQPDLGFRPLQWLTRFTGLALGLVAAILADLSGCAKPDLTDPAPPSTRDETRELRAEVQKLDREKAVMEQQIVDLKAKLAQADDRSPTHSPLEGMTAFEVRFFATLNDQRADATLEEKFAVLDALGRKGIPMVEMAGKFSEAYLDALIARDDETPSRVTFRVRRAIGEKPCFECRQAVPYPPNGRHLNQAMRDAAEQLAAEWRRR